METRLDEVRLGYDMETSNLRYMGQSGGCYSDEGSSDELRLVSELVGF